MTKKTAEAPMSVSPAQNGAARVRSEIGSSAGTIRLREPIVTVVAAAPYGWSIDCEALGIYASGKTEDEAWRDFDQQFVATADGLVDEPDERLTEDAQALKRRILSHLPTE